MRTLIYTCCDEKYSHFIPLFCAALLWSNENIDIEIWVNISSLTEKEETALSNLRNIYKDSQILIKYNMFTINDANGVYNRATYNNYEMMINSVRFVGEPTIIDDFTYISDIDIISFDKNFYLEHINRMNENKMIYDNIVRTNNISHLSGLHFVKTNMYYPLNLTNIRFNKNDEELLKDICSNKTKINYSLTKRPVHGIHMSLNRPYENGKYTVMGWGAKPYKNIWKEFKLSETYNVIKDSFDDIIKNQITQLEEYYDNI